VTVLRYGEGVSLAARGTVYRSRCLEGPADLEQDDGAAISEESRLKLEGIDRADVVLFDLS
jgi:hypothetical protein